MGVQGIIIYFIRSLNELIFQHNRLNGIDKNCLVSFLVVINRLTLRPFWKLRCSSECIRWCPFLAKMEAKKGYYRKGVLGFLFSLLKLFKVALFITTLLLIIHLLFYHKQSVMTNKLKLVNPFTLKNLQHII